MFSIKDFGAKTLSWWNTQRGQIDLEPSYQRKGGIWSAEDKAFLVDSILNGYDIPKIYLADFTFVDTDLNERRKSYAVIDGKQRLEAIFDFFDGDLLLDEEFSLESDNSLKLGGLSYKELRTQHPNVASMFENFNLDVKSVITDQEGKINDLFVRLNRSKPLTGAEVRSAMKGAVPRLIRKIAEHAFFHTCIRFSTKRKQEHNVAAKILLIEFRGKLVDTKKVHLDRFVQEGIRSQTTSFRRAATRVHELLDAMRRVFIRRDPLLSSEGPITVYYWFIKNNPDALTRIRPFLMSFEAARRENRQRAAVGRRADEELLRYDILSRSINDQGSLTERLRILERRFRRFARSGS
jgi:hypothetical protein